MRQLVVVLVVVAVLLSGVCAYSDDMTNRWLLIQSCLTTQGFVDPYLAAMADAHTAGYNGVLMAYLPWFNDSSEFRSLLTQVKNAAEANGLDVYVGNFTGCGADRLNLNMFEGLPVTGALFHSNGTTATHVADTPAPSLVNGGFEDSGSLAPWGAAPGVIGTPGHNSSQCARLDDPGPGGQTGCMGQWFSVKQHHQYVVTYWMMFDEAYLGPASNPNAITTRVRRPFPQAPNPVLGASCMSTSWVTPRIDGTPAPNVWVQYREVFNSLDQESLEVTFQRHAGPGHVWIDDVSIQEVPGLLHPLRRRAGTPLTVVNADPPYQTYVEGVDYQTIAGPTSLTEYTPQSINVISGRIPNGTDLKVSYYVQHMSWGKHVCISDDALFGPTGYLRQEFDFYESVFHPKGFFVNDDENRVSNWDGACQKRGLGAGANLAYKMEQIRTMVHNLRPDAEVWTWDDLYSPVGNTGVGYYCVNGSWAGSWKGLDSGPNMADVGVINWQSGAPTGQQFFADRGLPQIDGGFYDFGTGGWDARAWFTMTADVPNIIGDMYCTWRSVLSEVAPWGEGVWGVDAVQPLANFSSDPLPITARQSPDYTGRVVGTSPLTVTFKDLSVNSPTSWAWDFDNNGTTDSTAPNPTHTFSGSPGTRFAVKLTVTGPLGSDQEIKEGYVVIASGTPPAMDFTADDTTVGVGQTVNFTATSSGGTPTSVCWRFGDGTGFLGYPNASHAYTAAGTYPVWVMGCNSVQAGVDGQGQPVWEKCSTAELKTFYVTVGGGGGDTPYVTSFTPGRQRNDFTGHVGMRITVGASPLTVTASGRAYIDGSASHAVRIATTGGTEIASTNVSGGTPGQLTYAAISPVVLSANTSYYITSDETQSGDHWYDGNTVITHTSAAALPIAVRYDGTWSEQSFGADHAYVPVSFKYATGGGSAGGFH